MDPDDRLVSFDVGSLYTCIPINEAIDVINGITDLDTAHLVEIYLTWTFFSFEGEFFEKTCGDSSILTINLTPLSSPWRQKSMIAFLSLMFLFRRKGVVHLFSKFFVKKLILSNTVMQVLIIILLKILAFLTF